MEIIWTSSCGVGWCEGNEEVSGRQKVGRDIHGMAGVVGKWGGKVKKKKEIAVNY